jgi:hypothetical protein
VWLGALMYGAQPSTSSEMLPRRCGWPLAAASTPIPKCVCAHEGGVGELAEGRQLRIMHAVLPMLRCLPTDSMLSTQLLKHVCVCACVRACVEVRAIALEWFSEALEKGGELTASAAPAPLDSSEPAQLLLDNATR